jgi:hypothetical protein
VRRELLMDAGGVLDIRQESGSVPVRLYTALAKSRPILVLSNPILFYLILSDVLKIILS